MRWTLPGVAAAVLAMATAAAALPARGRPAPTFTGKTVQGKRLSLAQYRGKVVLLNFFNFYCGPCHEEYPHLQAMQKRFGPRGFTVISISNDPTIREAGAFAKEVKATFPVVHDPRGQVFAKYSVSPIPANLVVDRRGRIVFTQEGANIPALQAAVTRALAAR